MFYLNYYKICCRYGHV